jgi:hypothetical protein
LGEHATDEEQRDGTGDRGADGTGERTSKGGCIPAIDCPGLGLGIPRGRRLLEASTALGLLGSAFAGLDWHGGIVPAWAGVAR